MAHVIEAVLQLKDNMSATLKIAGDNLESFGKGLKRQGNQIRNFGNTVGYLGQDLLSLNAPFLALGGWASKLGMDFQAVTSEAQAVMRASSSEMEVFKDKAREIGAATSKSATESMEAMKLLGQAGLSQNEILELSYPLVRLSEAGNLGMAKSADLLTNSMNSANIQLKDSGKYLDQVALAANESSTSIELQLEAWNSAGGAIDSANMKMSEANALFGILANRGVKGAQAGNTVSRVFQNLNATSGEAGKAMQALDISVKNSDGSLRNKIDVLKELKMKTDNMTEAQREQYLTMIGGKAHTENLKKILAGLGEEYDELEDTLKNSNGALEEMAQIMKDNLQGKLETLSSSFQDFGLDLAELLLPRIEKVIDSIQKFVNKLSEMDSTQLDSIINIVLFSTKLAFLLIVVGKTINTFGSFAKNIGSLIEVVGKITGGFKIFGLSGLKLIPIFLLIAAVIYTVVKHWDKIGPSIQRAISAIKDFITSSEGIMSSFENIKEALSNIFSGLADMISGFFQIVEGIFTGNSDLIKEGIVNMFQGGVTIVKNLWLGLLNLLSIPIEATAKLLEGRFPNVAAFIRGIWDGLKSFLSNPAQALANLRDRASSKMQKVRENWNRTKSRLANSIRGRVNALTSSFQSKMQGVKKKWQEVKTFLKNPIKGTVSLVQKGGKWLGSKLGRNWQGTPNWTGGPTFLHEKGGEIYDLPGGTRVYPHDKSIEMARKEGMAQSQASNRSVVVSKLADTIVVREDSDIDKIAEALARKLEETKPNLAYA